MCLVQGTVFNIQKYSIHDGPGIRTTVFLKGCPFNCRWCHNPESMSPKPEIVFSSSKCILCGDCYDGCINEAIINNKESFVRDKEKCILCGKCSEDCPAEAIEMIGRIVSVSDVVKEIRKDMIFYEESGGGVTFSGGEPLMQMEFLENILIECKREGIHTAIDTSGYTSWDNLLRVSSNVDLFLYDIKHMDNEKHMQFTGVSNKKILENLKKLVSLGKKIWIRVPIIPTLNDSEDNVLQIAELIKSIELKDIFLLPYHNIATHKYGKLDMKYEIADIQTPSDKHMNEIAMKLKSQGLNVKIGG